MRPRNMDMEKTLERIGRHDPVYADPPRNWQDGFLLGNGSLGALFYAPDALQWIVNKTDVIDGRTMPVRTIIPPDEARRRVRAGMSLSDFQHAEIAGRAPEGAGPKSCCLVSMELGYANFGAGHPALPRMTARLGLADATVRVAVDKHLFHPRVTSYVDAHANLLAIRVRDVSPVANPCTRVIFTRPEDIALPEPRLSEERGRVLLRMDLPEAGSYAAGFLLVPREGTAYRDLMRTRMRPQFHTPAVGTVQRTLRGRYAINFINGDFDVFVAAASSRDAADPAAEVHRLLDAAEAREWEAAHQAHAGWWEAFWRRSRVVIADAELERDFYRSLYALGATYRAGRTPIAGLCGLAYGPDTGPIQVTPWNGDLHHDLNVECPFLPVFALNHGDLAEAYIETYHQFLPRARRLARDVWAADGAQFAMCVNALGEPIDGGVGTYRFFFGGAYVALIHCLAWRYRRDPVQMRERLLPFLREILVFYQGLAVRGADGRDHFAPAHAPELNLADVADPVLVIALLKVCLATAIEGSEVLDEPPGERERWRDLLEHLPSYPTGVDPRGRTVIVDGVGVAADHCVTQAGCLFPTYPCGEVDAWSPEAARALAQATFDSASEKIAYYSYGIERGRFLVGAHPIFFQGMTALRLGRADEFWQTWFPMFRRACGKPSGLMSHNAAIVVDPDLSEKNLETIPDGTIEAAGERMPLWEPWHGHAGFSSPNPRCKELAEPLIEANGDFLSLLTETMLQSHNGVIRVFPAWRNDLDACFEDFVAEGAVAVSATYHSGRVESIRLRRLDDGATPRTVLLLSPWTGQVARVNLADPSTVTLTPPA